MPTVISNTTPLLDWSTATRSIPGEAISGDLHLVTPFAGGELVAMVDGLGHGEEAARAARCAVATLATHAGESVLALVQRCHQALRGTRGAVMNVASFDAAEQAMTWIGIGNVEGILLRDDATASIPAPPEAILMRGGVVGFKLPPLRASVLAVAPGDLLIFATDGVRGEFVDDVPRHHAVPHIASYILQTYYRGSDDALVLVARYRGAPCGRPEPR